MNAIRTENYKSYTIRIVVLSPSGPERTFRATYQIHKFPNDRTPQGGIVAGALTTVAEAEEAALTAAKLAIDTRE